MELFLVRFTLEKYAEPWADIKVRYRLARAADKESAERVAIQKFEVAAPYKLIRVDALDVLE